MPEPPRRRPIGRLAVAVLLAAAVGPALPAESPACSSSGPDLLELRPPGEAAEGEAPGAVSVKAVTVRRGRGPVASGCGEMSTSCDDIGRIRLELEPAVDPDSAEREVGYLVEVLGGPAPPGLAAFDGPVILPREGDAAVLSLSWVDDASDEQEPLMFWLSIRAVDVDGHEGPPSAPIPILDDGS